MTLAITGALGDGTAVQNVSYIDDTLLLGTADEVAEAHDRLAARLRHTGLELQPTKTKVWAPNMENVVANPGLAHLERQNPSGGGLLIVGEALGAEDEEAQVLGTSRFVHAHLRKMADLVAQDCVRIQHLPEHLVAQEAGMQLGFALLQRTLPSRILHLLRGQATEHTAELCETLTTHAHGAAELVGTPSAQCRQLGRAGWGGLSSALALSLGASSQLSTESTPVSWDAWGDLPHPWGRFFLCIWLRVGMGKALRSPLSLQIL